MDRRIQLQYKLEELLGSKHVYYQPRKSVKIEYPAIVYSKNRIVTKKANNSNYRKLNSYNIIVIDRRPDNPVIEKILDLPHCSYDRSYVADNLHHDSLTLYY